MGQESRTQCRLSHINYSRLSGLSDKLEKTMFARKWLTNRWLQISIVVAAAAVLLLMPSPLPDYLTTFDFQAYWGASNLLSRSENFTDPALLLEIERAATGFDQDVPLFAWNPPWFLAWLLPLSIIGFDRASWIWFLINIVLVFSSTVMLWRVFASRDESMRRLWIGLIVSFLFLPTLTTLLVGQIAALILFGVAAFLFFDNSEKPFLAGMALSLTTAKPHVIYLTLALILLDLIYRRQWRTIAGFITPVLAGTIVTFILRPAFLSDYASLMTNSQLLQRTAVPTPVSYLAEMVEQPWLRYAGLLILLGGLFLWWRRRQPGAIDRSQLVVVTLILSLLTTPYAWSFDFILFLVPALQVAMWIVEDRISRIQAAFIVVFFAAANVAVFYQRSLQAPENEFFWFPLLLAFLYAWGWRSATTGEESRATHRSPGMP